MRFWVAIESLLNGSEESCELFTQSNGLKQLMLSMSYCSSYEINRCFVRIINHVLCSSSVKAIERSEIVKFLELIAGSASYKDKKVCTSVEYVWFLVRFINTKVSKVASTLHRHKSGLVFYTGYCA